MGKLHVFKTKHELLETITELEKDIKVDKELMDELLQTRILQSEVHSDIEKVWMYDATLTKDLSAYQKRKRSEAIERVFYKVANQWIDCISEPNDNDFGPYWCEDENGNLVEMTKVEGSRVMSKEEVEQLNKIKLPF